MTEKNSTIAFVVQGEKTSAAQRDAVQLQYNLLGRGFTWSSGDDSFCDLSSSKQYALLVNIKTKRIKWGIGYTVESVKDEAYFVVNLFTTVLSEALNYLDNPPKPPPEYTEIKGIDDNEIRVYPDGDVEIVDDTETVVCTMNESVVKGIAKELGIIGKRRRLPIASFNYPSSQSWTGEYTQYIQGFEVDSELDEQGTFKKFKVSRVRGAILLHSFLQD